jgi:hypothetical protein
MNDSRSYFDDGRNAPVTAPSGQDLLPPIEPPSAGFIVQLFVVPGLIVLAIVGVWLTLHGLVQQTSIEPDKLVEGLEQGSSVARWQRASDLAEMLYNKRYPEFRRNREAAAHVGQILERQIDGGGMSEDDVRFRFFLAKALGEFDVQEGVDALVKAAKTNRDSREQNARDGALQAIASRVYNLHQLNPPQEVANAELEPALLGLAGDEDANIRFQAAYALGQVATPAAFERLAVMVDDPDPDTRYNAAIALAHHGKDAGVETLAEILEIDEPAGTAEESGEDHMSKRRVFIEPAMLAARELMRQNPSADLSPIKKALQQMANADSSKLNKAKLPLGVAAEARRTFDVLQSKQ